MTNKKKELPVSNYPKLEETHYDIKVCTKCDQQCLGHGGGVPVKEGCFCNDGTFQECLL